MNVCCCIKHELEMASYHPHFHDEYEIILNLSGHCTTIIGGKNYHIEKNDIIIIPPRTMHEAYSDIYFTDFFIQAKYLNFENVYVTKDNNGIILSLMNMLHSVMLEKESNYKSIADNLLETIYSYLVKYINVNYKYSFINSLKNIIIENFEDPSFNLASTIDKTGYTKDYLRRCFEQDIGKTPLEYLTGLRISKAKMLLVQSDFTCVKDVSERCGFSDNLYFSTVFKKNTGLSPIQYRKKHIGE